MITFTIKLSEERLAEMWCELNDRRVPVELKGSISNPSVEQLIPFMRHIERKIGKKACVEKWIERNKKKEN